MSGVGSSEFRAVDETWREVAKRANEAALQRMLGNVEIALDRACRKCGCTETNACWHEELGNCRWVSSDLCNACAPDADAEWEHPAVTEI